MATKKEKFFKTQVTGFSTTTINYNGYGYGRHCAGMTNVYGYSPEGIRFDYIVTPHRANVICSMIRSGQWWTLDADIRSNYSTNGYNTRWGIRRANLLRCRKMAESHAAITLGGKDGHDARVMMRNR